MNNFFNTWSSLTGVTASMEDNVMLPSGLEVEIELDYYGRLTDINEVIKLSSKVEDQEQWSARNRANGSQIRVRQSIIDGGSPSYELTFKGVKVDGAVPESNVEINAQFFFGFKESFATSGMIKTRYSIPFEHEGHSLCWEVDVFEGTDWVKIDLELPNKEITLPTSFPFGITEVMRGGSDKTVRTEEQQKQLDSLYTDHFAVRPAQVSMEEGILTSIKNIFRGKKPKLDISSITSIKEELKNTYLNDAWLSKRGFKTGEVKIPAANYGSLLLNFDRDLTKAKSEASKVYVKNNDIVKYVNKQLAEIKTYILSGQHSDAKTKQFNTTLDNVDKKTYGFFEYSDWSELKYTDAIVSPLDKKGVVVTASKIIEIIDTIMDTFSLKFLEVESDDIDSNKYDGALGKLASQWETVTYGTSAKYYNVVFSGFVFEVFVRASIAHIESSVD